MPTFQYLARDAAGGRIEGVIDTTDGAALAETLAGQGLVLVRLEQTSAAAAAQGSPLQRWLEPKIGPDDLLLFFRQLATLLKAGVPILRALRSLQESSTSRRFGAVLSSLQQQLEAGRDFSSSLQREGQYFSPYVVNMVRVGEVTGQLPDVLQSLFTQMSFERESREQTKAALRYPTFVVCTGIAALVVVNIVIIPVFAKVYRGMHADLPLVTTILIATSDFTIQYWPLLLLLSVGAVFGYSYAMRTERGRLVRDELFLRMPILGPILRKAALARFTKSFGLALNAGVPVVEALQVAVETTGNVALSDRIRTVRTAAERGESLVRAARNTGVFTPIILQMVSVGEETGALGDMLDQVADFYRSEVEYAMKGLAAQIEPIMIVMLGVIVLIIALGVFLPMWDLAHVVLHHN